jgi:uncharacterized repeat protein (TIGR01451 family)
MRTPSTSTILHLAGKMKRPPFSITHRAKRRVRTLTSLVCFSALFFVLVATAFYSASSAATRAKVSRSARQQSSVSSKATGRALAGRGNKSVFASADTDLKQFNSKTFFGMLLPQAGPESIDTYEVDGTGNCTNNPKDTFNLGEKVCARVANSPLRAAAALRRVSINGTNGAAAGSTDVVSNPQTLIITLPSEATSTVNGETVDNRGTWSATINSTADYGVRAVAYFSVSDPDNTAADLVVYAASTSSELLSPGQPTGFSVWLNNDGPDAAENVHVTQTVPPNMTFVLAGSGNAAFPCTLEAGVVDCAAAQNVAKGAISTFTINYLVNAGAPNSIITTDVNISGDTTDPRPASNSSTVKVEIRGAGGEAPTCSVACPGDLTVTADTTNGANEPGAIVNFAGNIETSGDCGTVSSSPASGSFFPVGSTTVSVTSSAGGGVCSFTITVVEVPPPTITCQANIGVDAADGECSAAVTVPTPEATGDNVEVDAVRSDGQPLTDPFPGGTTIITWTATDSLGRKVSCQQTVTVTIHDTTPPTITAPPNVSIQTPGGTSGNCGVVVGETELGTPTASDSCAVNVSRTGVPSGNFFPIGTTTITYTATNGAGLTATATQTVTIIDTTPPIIVAPPDASYTCLSEVPAANPNQATAPFVDANGNVQNGPPSDNCGTPTVTVTQTSSGAGSAGSPRVILRTFTATDGSGNTASATQTITVSDPTPPTISCPANITTYLPLNSTAVTTPVTFAATASDNCEAPVITYSPASGSNFPVGTTTVTATATDGGGNTASCTFTVTVLYNFTGFFSPVNNLPTLNVVNAGRAIPVKFSLSGNKGLNIFAPNSPASGLITCNSSDPAADLTDTVTAGGSSLSYDASSGQYNYVWKTESSWAGTCRQLVLTLNDGSVHRANFKFK